MINDLNKDDNSCAAWIVKFLKEKKVEIIFGLQGGHIQPIWDYCFKLGIKILDVRDEKAAVHMAQAYNILTGKIGVAMVTAGPGVTNTVTGIANACLSSNPVLLIGGCSPIPQSNMGSLQDIPSTEILKPITRYSKTARVSEQLIKELDLAYSSAIGHIGEPGPSYIEIPTDILRENIKEKIVLKEWLNFREKYRPFPNPNDILMAIEAIKRSKRPLIITGRGAKECKKELKEFIDKTNILYLDTQDSRGVVSNDHPNNVFTARHNTMSEADLVILLGRKLDYQLAFGSPAIFKKAKFIRISDSSHELLDNRRGFPEIFANPEESLKQITMNINNLMFDNNWIENIKTMHQDRIKKSNAKVVEKLGEDGKINPNLIFKEIKSLTSNNFIGIADGGDILSFARVGLNTRYYLDSGVFGCLGVGVPYSIAASEVHKDKKVICVTGDGAFGFNAMEIDTAVRNNSNICIIISNNAGWNIEAHDQKINYGNRIAGTKLNHSDYAKMAIGLGAFGIRVENPEDLKNSIKLGLENTPSVIDVVTSSSFISSDALKGLGFVPKYQALNVWDDLEKEYRA